jgi:hypothetical protein
VRNWRSELFRKSQMVPVDEGIYDLSVGDVMDCGSVDGYFIVCCGNARELAVMGAGKCPSDYNFFIFAKDVLPDTLGARRAWLGDISSSKSSNLRLFHTSS